MLEYRSLLDVATWIPGLELDQIRIPWAGHSRLRLPGLRFGPRSPPTPVRSPVSSGLSDEVFEGQTFVAVAQDDEKRRFCTEKRGLHLSAGEIHGIL